ncbi:MAG: hypothetical protein VW551_02820 [Euryarchaeota archaeon]|jgi:hypothetical protein
MAQRQKGQKTYTTMQGKQIDMDLLRKRNELTPAVGNVRVNARGDELGPGGKIIKKREDVIKDYYNNSSMPVADEPSHLTQPASTEQVEKPKASTKKTSKAQKKVEEAELSKDEQEMFEDMDDEWVEDEDGNFVKKGS